MKSPKIIYSVIGLSVLTSILFSLAYLFALHQKQNQESLYLEHKLSQADKEFKMLQNTYTLLAQNLYDNIIHSETVITLVKTANFSDPEDLAPLRNELYQELIPVYDNLRTQGISKLHFQLQGNVNFLRFDNPNKFGDSLVGLRYSIDKVNRTQQAVHGFEEGMIFNGFRNVFPVLSNRRLIGTVELSYSFSTLRDEALKTSNGYYAFIMKQALSDKRNANDEKDNHLPSTLSSQYVHDIKTLSPRAYVNFSEELVAKINNSIAPEASIKLSQSEPFVLHANVQNKSYIVTFIPSYNIENKHVAYFISYHEDDMLSHIYDNYITQLIVSMIVMFILSVLVFLYLYSRQKTHLVHSDLTTSDALTKIANKHKFELVLDHTMQMALRYELPLSIVTFDVDDFQAINDKLGLDTGDDILVELSALVTKKIRLSDLFARWNGATFVILLPETNFEQAGVLAEKLRVIIDDRSFGVSIHIACSFGVTQLHKDDNRRSLLARAELALKSAKDRGKNRVVEIQ